MLSGHGLRLGPHFAGRDLPDPLRPAWDALFLGEDAPRFGFLYPLPSAEEEASQGLGDAWPFPPPVTAHSCKYHPGYGTADGRASEHGVVDVLLERIRECIDHTKRPELKCPRCSEQMQRFQNLSFMRRLAPEGAPYRFAETTVPARYLTRVAIDRRTSRASEHLLYTLQVLEPAGYSFGGELRASEEQVEALARQLAQIPMADDPEGDEGPMALRVRLRIGSARARGLGEAWLTLRKSADVLGSVEERLDRFQPRGLPDGSRPRGVAPGERLDPRHLYFSLTLRAPAIVRSRHGTPTMEVDGAVLAAYGLQVPRGLEWLQEASFVEPSVASGWSLAWSLPKPTGPALAAGSVLTYRVPAEEREAVVAFLKALESQGLGERVKEGFGEIIACFPFHVQLDWGLHRAKAGEGGGSRDRGDDRPGGD